MKTSEILQILRRLEGILEGVAACEGATISMRISSELMDCCEVLDELCDKIEKQGA
jgi:hypothetical protein